MAVFLSTKFMVSQVDNPQLLATLCRQNRLQFMSTCTLYNSVMFPFEILHQMTIVTSPMILNRISANFCCNTTHVLVFPLKKIVDKCASFV